MSSIEILIFEFESLVGSYNIILSDIYSSNITSVNNYAINGLPLLSTSSDVANCSTACSSNNQCVAAVQDGQTCNLYTYDGSFNAQLVEMGGDTTYLKSNLVKLYLLLSIISQIRYKIEQLRANYGFNETSPEMADIIAFTEEQLVLDELEITNIIQKSESLTKEYQNSELIVNSSYALYNQWFYLSIFAIVAAFLAVLFVML